MNKIHWLAGTSGYSYKEWQGNFYPKDVKAADRLAYYASQLPAVEINNTFYRMPRSQVLESWAEAVPQDFRFVLKASRRITHQAKLENAEEPTQYLAQRAALLESKLGAVLFQLPSYIRKNPELLNRFLDTWPDTLPAAFEFRHDSWFDDEIFDLLTQRGVALCVSDDEKHTLPKRLATTDWLYLRLRRPDYQSPTLAKWQRDCAKSAAKTGFVFFKHEDAGVGPKLAAQFLALANKPEPKRAKRVKNSATTAQSTKRK